MGDRFPAQGLIALDVWFTGSPLRAVRMKAEAPVSGWAIHQFSLSDVLPFASMDF